MFVFCISICVVSFAQTAEDSVKATVNALFAAMKNSNGKALLNCFADNAILQTISSTKEGVLFAKSESVNDFANSIARMPVNAADERISFETIKIDGPLAIVWTPYNLYFNGSFIHCGVNSFQLLRFNGIWKIQYLIDTRRKVGCVEK